MGSNRQRLSALIGIGIAMLFVLNSCLSTTTAVSKVQAYDSSVIKEQLAGPELPQGIHYTWSDPLPNKTSVKKSYFMILPLLVVNVFQTNHKVTLGQSSLELPIDDMFKREFLNVFDSLPWNMLHQHGHSMDIEIREIKSTGVFASGFASIIGAGNTGAMGKMALCMRIQTKIQFKFTLYSRDSILLQRNSTLLVNSGDWGNLKLSYIDSKTGRTILITKLPYVITGDSFEILLPLIKEVCTICLKEASREIADRTKDSLRDYYRDNL